MAATNDSGGHQSLQKCWERSPGSFELLEGDSEALARISHSFDLTAHVQNDRTWAAKKTYLDVLIDGRVPPFKGHSRDALDTTSPSTYMRPTIEDISLATRQTDQQEAGKTVSKILKIIECEIPDNQYFKKFERYGTTWSRRTIKSVIKKAQPQFGISNSNDLSDEDLWQNSEDIESPVELPKGHHDWAYRWKAEFASGDLLEDD
ncbi:hypothetical protein L486_01801 [Kwoniella mangroviensis CBS 10435]|uniref:Uncharacterized protein n=1 Tax=Kwoniella mangroviensis CBS 10435 TaxID=1331196 RepID=A0A1B9J393_9TREE|nr:hypothetical protein L486_01801 [Kwoniella mangroviensis CBS 10435]